MTLQQKQPQIQVTYVDRPELGEIYADTIHSVQFDAHACRLVFALTRSDDRTPGKPMSGKQYQYPCARIVMPPAAGIHLAEKLKQLLDLMEQQGAIVRAPMPPMPPAPPAPSKH